MFQTILNFIRRKPAQVRWFRAVDRNYTDLGLLFTCTGCGKQLLNPPEVVVHCGQKDKRPDNLTALFLPDKQISTRRHIMRPAFDEEVQVTYVRGTP
jgi:hypothetical protein